MKSQTSFISYFKEFSAFLYTSIKHNPSSKRFFIGANVFALLILSMNVINPLLLKNIVQILESTRDEINKNFLLSMATIYSISWIFCQVLIPLKGLWGSSCGEHILCSSTQEYLNKLHSLPASFLSNNSSGYLLGIMNKAERALHTLIGELLLTVLPTVIEFIIIVGVIVYEIGIISGIIFILSTLFLVISSNFGIKSAIKCRHISNYYGRKVPEKFVDSILNFEIISLFHMQEKETLDFEKILNKKCKAEIGYLRNSEYLRIRQIAINGATFLILNIITIQGIIRNTYQVSDFIFVNAVFLQLMTPLSLLGELLRDCYKSYIDLKPYIKILNEPLSSPKHRKIISQIQRGRIEFKNVSFSYDKRIKILDNVSFVIKETSKTSLIGSSGCGKSTIVKLLVRLYEPDDGEILIDGTNILDYDLDSLRRQIGIVPQDTIMFNDTIENNIACANLSAKYPAIIEAAKAAELHDCITLLPAGYKTTVGERGIRLSGGEKQRISLARIFLKSPKIIILDEAMLTLDPHRRKQISQFIKRYGQDKTIINITHFAEMIDNNYPILNLDIVNNSKFWKHLDISEKLKV